MLNSILLITFANNLDQDQARQSGSNMFDTQMVILTEFFEKVDFEKNRFVRCSLI